MSDLKTGSTVFMTYGMVRLLDILVGNGQYLHWLAYVIVFIAGFGMAVVAEQRQRW